MANFLYNFLSTGITQTYYVLRKFYSMCFVKAYLDFLLLQEFTGHFSVKTFYWIDVVSVALQPGVLIQRY